MRDSEDDIVCPDATVKSGRLKLTDGSGDAGLGGRTGQTPGWRKHLPGQTCPFGIAREIWASSREIGT